MLNFVNAKKDGIALFDNMGYVLFPGQGTVDGDSKHFNKGGGFKDEIIYV